MDAELEGLLELLPVDSRESARRAWRQVPPDVRAEMRLTYSMFSKLVKQRPGSLLDLLRLGKRATGAALTGEHQVAIVGPVNVGKSTLYNDLVPDAKDRAEAGPIPGLTREVQTAETGLFQLMDTPGADSGADLGPLERNLAMQAVDQADFLIIVFDATTGVNRTAKELYDELKTFKKPHLLVLNKIDLIQSKDRQAVVQSASRILRVPPELLHPISALNREGVEKLVLEMAALEPALLGRIGAALPLLRRRLAWQAVRRAAVASAVVALTPLPVLDLIPLTLLQSTMVMTLAKIYDQKMGPFRLLELGSSFGLGWLARLLFQEVSKLGGAPGWVLSSSIATSATMTIGYAAITWFETGQKADRRQLEEYARGSQQHVVDLLKEVDPGRAREELDKGLPEAEG